MKNDGPMSRALRRHHVARLKRNRAHWWGRELSPVERAKVVTTPTPCSCWMCTSPRYGQGEVTLQERRARLAMDDGG